MIRPRTRFRSTFPGSGPVTIYYFVMFSKSVWLDFCAELDVCTLYAALAARFMAYNMFATEGLLIFKLQSLLDIASSLVLLSCESGQCQ